MGDDHLAPLRFDALTPIYDAVVRATVPEDAFRDRVVEEADVGPGDRVLDVGCGTGSLLSAMVEEAPRCRTVGLDPDPAALAHAREKLPVEQVALVRGTGTDLPFPDGTVDRVVSTLALHHLAEPAKRETLAEIRRVLSPDGRFVLGDWGAPSSGLMAAAFVPVRLLDGWAITAAHADGRVPDLLDGAGFDAVEAAAFDTLVGTIRVHRCTPRR